MKLSAKHITCALSLLFSSAAAFSSCAPDFVVKDETLGKELPFHQLSANRYIESTFGHFYSVSLRNNCPHEVFAVLRIDGRNTVNGVSEPLMPRSTQPGYLLPAGSAFVVKGWRVNDSQASAFAFAPFSSTYAAYKDLQPSEQLGSILVDFFAPQNEGGTPANFISSLSNHGELGELFGQHAHFSNSYSFRSHLRPSTFASGSVDNDTDGISLFQHAAKPFKSLSAKYLPASELVRIGLYDSPSISTPSRPLIYDARHIPSPAKSHAVIKK